MRCPGPFDRIATALAVAVPLLLAACTAQSERLGGAALPQVADTPATTAPDAAAPADAGAPAADVDVAPVDAADPAAVDPAAADLAAVDPAAIAATASDPALGPLVTAANVHWLRIVPALRTATAGQSPAALVDAAAFASDGTLAVAVAPADGVAAQTAAQLDRGAAVGYVALAVCCRPVATPAPIIRPPNSSDPLAAPAVTEAPPLPTRPCCLAASLPNGVFRVVVRQAGEGPVKSGGGSNQTKILLRTFVADLTDAGGRVVESWPAVVSEEPSVALAPWAGVALDRGGPVTVRFHAGRWKIEASRIIP